MAPVKISGSDRPDLGCSVTAGDAPADPVATPTMASAVSAAAARRPVEMRACRIGGVGRAGSATRAAPAGQLQHLLERGAVGGADGVGYEAGVESGACRGCRPVRRLRPLLVGEPARHLLDGRP